MRTLVRWDPSAEVDSLQSEVNRLFNGFFGADRTGSRAFGDRRWIPPMDVRENEDDISLTVDLPGLSRDDVSIEIKDGVLTVAGERRAEREREDGGYHRIERSYGSFSRSVGLPDGVAEEDVSASFDNGVLDVRIPKPAEREPHRVAIGGGSAPELEGEARPKEG